MGLLENSNGLLESSLDLLARIPLKPAMPRVILFNKPYDVLSQFTDVNRPPPRATLSQFVDVASARLAQDGQDHAQGSTPDTDIAPAQGLARPVARWRIPAYG